MTDVFTKKKRSAVMSPIKATNTKPERAVRSILHGLGFRFRLHRADLLGKPDIVLARHKTVVFVHGCFWHRHKGCQFAYTPKSRKKFWQNKFESNVARDRHVNRGLVKIGWRVISVWECELRMPDRVASHLHAALSQRRKRPRS